MSNYTDQKSTIFAKLQEVDALYADATVNTYLERPEKIEALPAITYNVENDVPAYTVEGTVAFQDVTAKIDIWGNTSNVTGSITKIVIEQMLEIGYRCTFNQHLVDPTGISHVTTQFEIKT